MQTGDTLVIIYIAVVLLAIFASMMCYLFDENKRSHARAARFGPDGKHRKLSYP